MTRESLNAKATKASLPGWIRRVEETISILEERADETESDAKREKIEAALEVWQELLDALEQAVSDLE